MWIRFKPLLNVLACVDMFFLLLLSQQAGNKLGGNPTHVHIAFKDAVA
jgi:hypothetical protein